MKFRDTTTHYDYDCGSEGVSQRAHLRASAAVPRPCADPAVARPRAMGSAKPNLFTRATS